MQTDAPPQPTAEELGAALDPKYKRLADAFLANNLNKRAAARACGYTINKSGSGANRHYVIFRREDVQAYIAARLEEEAMAASEVLARLAALARTDGSQFLKEEEYEVPIYEDRPLQERIDHLHAQVGRMHAIDPGLLKPRIEKAQAEIAELEVELALDPAATYQKQVRTETRTRIVPSLEAAAENGVLFAIESVEYTQHGLKFKRQDPVKALELIGKHHKLFTDRTEHSGSVDLGVKYIAGLSEDDL